MVAWATDTGNVHVGDYWSSDRSTPKLDSDIGGIDNIEDSMVINDVDNDILTVSFTRRFQTGDRYDLDIPRGIGRYIYAWNDQAKPGEFLFHGVNNWHVVRTLTIIMLIPNSMHN
jgi:hypothetical protein